MICIYGWRVQRHNVTVALILMALSLTACDRAAKRSARADESMPGANATLTSASASSQETEEASGHDDVPVSTGTVSGAYAKFSGRLEHCLAVREILSSTGMTYEAISNRVAHIDTPVILDVVAEEYDRPVDRNVKGSKQRAAMLLYQVVYERGEPAWARAFALSEMIDYYWFNADLYSGEAQWASKEADRLALSANYDDAELRTYLSIKLRLCAAVYEPERALRNMAEIERCVQAGLLHATAQPVLILPLMKAQALLNLRRVDDARAVVQELYERRGSVDGITRDNLKDGVEAFIRRNQSSDIYPELFNPATGRRYDDTEVH